MDFVFSIYRKLMPLAIAALLSSACVIIPARPLMSVWNKESGFGYSEKNIGKSRLEITYVAPFLRTQSGLTRREADVTRLRTLAEDMTLLRAADIARTGNYVGLKVVTTRSDVTIERYDDNPRIVRYGLAHVRGGFLYEQIRAPPFRSTWIQAKEVIVVILKRKRVEDDLGVAETAERLVKKHQGARTLPAY